jgi:hypothetical protein
MDTYRIVVEFTSGNELVTTVDKEGLKKWIASEQFGNKVRPCDGYQDWYVVGGDLWIKS